MTALDDTQIPIPLRGGSLILVVARVCLSLLFVISGFEKIFTTTQFATYMAGNGIPFADASPYLAIVIEFIGGLVFILGFKTRTLAILFAIYTIVTAFIGHHFWTMSGPARGANQINFLKNVGIAGGFLLVFVAGAGRYSLDYLMTRESR